jgi:hypothetical protein
MKNASIMRKVIYSYIVLVVVYLVITFLTHPDPAVIAKYHISTLSLRFLSLSFTIPLMLIWLTALYGFACLKGYSEKIKQDKDGKQVERITNGVMVLAYSLPISAIATGILNNIAQAHHGFLPASVIIGHYIALVFPLVAFLLISRGTRGLMLLVKARSSLAAAHIFGIIFTLVSVGYCYFVLNQGIPTHVTTMQKAVYYLPTWLVLLTLVVPYLYTWFIGFMAAYELYLYDQKVSGRLYKKSWRKLSIGLTAIIIMYIVVQYITTLSARLNRLNLSALLIIIYVLLAFISVGYIYIAVGAKKLKSIEEA